MKLEIEKDRIAVELNKDESMKVYLILASILKVMKEKLPALAPDIYEAKEQLEKEASCEGGGDQKACPFP